MIVEYILSFHLQDCLDIISKQDVLGYYSIRIDFLKLFETYPDIGDKVLCSPVTTLPDCDKDIIKVQQNILEHKEYKEFLQKLPFSFLKRNVHARFYGLPVCPELHRIIFPKNMDLGCFLKVTGTVVRVTQSKMLEYHRKYVCMKCKYENCVEGDFEMRYILKAPSKCMNTEPRCRCSTFTQVSLVSREYCKDYQEIKIQEQVNKLSVGTIPGSMWVILEDDLVDCCKPGDDVIICGTVRRRWRPSYANRKCEVELILQANYVQVINAQRSQVVAMAPDVKDCFDDFWNRYKQCPLKGRDQILASICPQVYGLYLVKLAVLLTVVTGSNHMVESNEKSDDHTSHVRGQCHLLLVGDPGTGKSQLLKAGAELTCRSVLTSGAGSTRAGLTCAALREEGEWQLEAGALVLADGGVCCIDEICHLRGHDRTAIHEAMEQQTISVAKMYISLIGPKPTKITKSANTIIQCYYMLQRKSQYRDPSRTTVRMLDSLIRLSQAHCRLMYRTTILPTDAIIAITLMDLSMQDCTLEDTTNALHSTFQKYPDYEYLCTAKKLLTRMNLCDIWKEELLYYGHLLQVDTKTLQEHIESNDSNLFTKFDDVLDDNMPLSATLVTSSYFNNKRKENVTLKDKRKPNNAINDKLAATLKKHATLNTVQKDPPVNNKKKGVKRKKKEVTLDISKFMNKKQKSQKESQAKIDFNLFDSDVDETENFIQLEKHNNSSCNNKNYKIKEKTESGKSEHKNKDNKENRDKKEKNESNEINVIPKKQVTQKKVTKTSPVNGSGKNMTKSHKETSSDSKNKKSLKVKISDKVSDGNMLGDSNDFNATEMLKHIPSVNDIFKEIGVDFTICGNDSLNTDYHKNNETQGNINTEQNDTNSVDNENISTTVRKLKQFECSSNHDLDKFYKEKVSEKIVKLSEKSISSLSMQRQTSSSQISMFESSDCDIDLDL